jgi:hypothetical protein
MIGSNITGYVTKTLMFRMKKVSVLIWKIIVLVVSIGATLAFLIWFLRERERNWSKNRNLGGENRQFDVC